MRGQIENIDRATQVIDFSGLKWNSITPTDVDGFIDFGDRVFVLMEFKFNNQPLKTGQRLALERAADILRAMSRDIMFFIVCASDLAKGEALDDKSRDYLLRSASRFRAALQAGGVV